MTYIAYRMNFVYIYAFINIPQMHKQSAAYLLSLNVLLRIYKYTITIYIRKLEFVNCNYNPVQWLREFSLHTNKLCRTHGKRKNRFCINSMINLDKISKERRHRVDASCSTILPYSFLPLLSRILGRIFFLKKFNSRAVIRFQHR